MSEEAAPALDFQDVLERDLANIVAKAATGQPLNARERGLIEQESKREQAKSAKTGRAAKTGFKKSYEDYSKVYGASPRTLKRWVATGKEKGLPCPLDEPVAMASWWSHCMTQKCPEGILDAAGGQHLPANTTAAEPPVFTNEKTGLEGALERMEQAEIILASRATEPGQAKPWLDTISRMTSTSTKLRQELAASGKLIPKIEVAAELKNFHGQIAAVLKDALSPETYREVYDLLQENVFK